MILQRISTTRSPRSSAAIIAGQATARRSNSTRRTEFPNYRGSPWVERVQQHEILVPCDHAGAELSRSLPKNTIGKTLRSELGHVLGFVPGIDEPPGECRRQIRVDEEPHGSAEATTGWSVARLANSSAAVMSSFSR
jgi:hypothetical protein